MNGLGGRGRPRATWADNIKQWTNCIANFNFCGFYFRAISFPRNKRKLDPREKRALQYFKMDWMLWMAFLLQTFKLKVELPSVWRFIFVHWCSRYLVYFKNSKICPIQSIWLQQEVKYQHFHKTKTRPIFLFKKLLLHIIPELLAIRLVQITTKKSFKISMNMLLK